MNIFSSAYDLKRHDYQHQSKFICFWDPRNARLCQPIFHDCRDIFVAECRKGRRSFVLSLRFTKDRVVPNWVYLLLRIGDKNWRTEQEVWSDGDRTVSMCKPSCRLASAHVGSFPRNIMTASSTFSTRGGGFPYDLISVISFLFSASSACNQQPTLHNRVSPITFAPK